MGNVYNKITAGRYDTRSLKGMSDREVQLKKIVGTAVGKLSKEHKDNIGSLVAEHDELVRQRKEDEKARWAEIKQHESEFHMDLAQEFGLENHPKEPELFRLAWMYGHSAGLYEVHHYYAEMSELLK